MRLIMLDTETTGLKAETGDKMVEIGAVSFENRDLSKKVTFQKYLNPQRSIPHDAFRVHGLTEERLAEEPTFPEVEKEFLAFIEGGTLVIHNAKFDLGFIWHELSDEGKKIIQDMGAIDTLEMAKRLYPRKRNNLNALCDRFDINRSHRALHGALLDAEILAEVYLAMSGGLQFSLGVDRDIKPVNSFISELTMQAAIEERQETSTLTRRPAVRIKKEDTQRHQTFSNTINEESGGQLIWTLPQRMNEALDVVQQADAILFVTGNKREEKVGYPDLTVTKDFKAAYPGVIPNITRDKDKVTPIQSAEQFKMNPEAVWAFYAGHINRCRNFKGSELWEKLFEYARSKRDGYFVQTTLIGGEMLKSECDEDRIVESNGSLHFIQCSGACSDFVDANQLEFELYLSEMRSSVPTCKGCGAPLRPNIRMIDDSDFIQNRLNMQDEKMELWLEEKRKKSTKVAILEIDGLDTSKLQGFSNKMAELANFRLIRINTDHITGRVPEGSLSLTHQKQAFVSRLLD